MKKLFTALFLVVGLTACHEIPCDDPASIASKVSDEIVSHWACTNPAAVNASIDKWMRGVDLCTADQKAGLDKDHGIVGDVLCPFLGLAFQRYASSQVPTEWGCDPSKVGVIAADALTVMCEALFPI